MIATSKPQRDAGLVLMTIYERKIRAHGYVGPLFHAPFDIHVKCLKDSMKIMNDAGLAEDAVTLLVVASQKISKVDAMRTARGRPRGSKNKRAIEAN